MIDVIIPAYNSHAWLKKLLLDLEKQSLKDKLLITIVDDGSVEGYEDLIKSLNLKLKINLFRLKTNHGAWFARNIGLKKTNNDYVMFLDSDDSLLNDTCIHDMYSLMLNEKICDLVYAKEENDNKIFFHPYHVVAKLFKREVINKYKIKFPNQKMEEDIAFTMMYETVISEKAIFKIDKVFYRYNHYNNKSVTAQNKFLINYDYKSFFDSIDLAYKYAKHYNKYDFFKNNISSIFISLAKLFYRYNDKEETNQFVKESYLKNCRHFYQKYIKYIEMSEKYQKYSENDYIFYNWFKNLMNC